MFTLLCAISIQILKFFCKDRRLSFYMSRTLHLFGTDWCAMMVPIQVIRWYRMQCYDGTDSCATVVPNRRYCQNYIISLLGDSKSSYSYSEMATSRNVKYKISPRVKALEMEFVCPENLSEDYKKEIKEGRIKKGL